MSALTKADIKLLSECVWRGYVNSGGPKRLAKLVALGMLRRAPLHDAPEGLAYRLTKAGKAQVDNAP